MWSTALGVLVTIAGKVLPDVIMRFLPKPPDQTQADLARVRAANEASKHGQEGYDDPNNLDIHR